MPRCRIGMQALVRGYPDRTRAPASTLASVGSSGVREREQAGGVREFQRIVMASCRSPAGIAWMSCVRVFRAAQYAR